MSPCRRTAIRTILAVLVLLACDLPIGLSQAAAGGAPATPSATAAPAGAPVTPAGLAATQDISGGLDPGGPGVAGAGDSAMGFGVDTTSGAAWSNALASVDPATGAAHATVPFLLAPARGQVQPSVGLFYDSSAGDGVGGVGWALTVPSIERRSPAGLVRPRYQDPAPNSPIQVDTQDRFVFGGNPLVPVCFIGGSDAACSAAASEQMPTFTQRGGWHYYRLQLERGDTLRFFWSPDHNTWVVQDKSGNTAEYGVPTDLNYDITNGVDTELLPINEANALPTAPYRWNLVRQYDANRLTSQTVAANTPANPVVYTWNGDGTLSDVYDTPPTAGSWPSLAAFAHHAHFTYGPRIGNLPLNTPMWRAIRGGLLTGVDVTSATLAAAGGRQLVRRYHLTYAAIDGRHEGLQTIQIEGRCTSPVAEDPEGILPPTSCERLPAQTFTYAVTPPVFDVQGVDMQGVPDQALANQISYLLDVNSDGLPDLVSTVAPAAATFNPYVPQTLYLNSTRGAPDSLDAVQLAVDSPSLDATPVNLAPGQVWHAPAVQGDSVVGFYNGPGVRSYAADFTGDGYLTLFWAGPQPLCDGTTNSGGCQPNPVDPYQWQWPIATYQYQPTTTGRWALAGGTQSNYYYQVPTTSFFWWLAAGDVDSDGYPDRLDAFIGDYEPSTLASGNAYFAVGVDFTTKARDGTITPFDQPYVQHSTFPPPYHIDDTAGYCVGNATHGAPPWYVAAQSALNRLIANPGNADINPPFWLVDMDGDGLPDIFMDDEQGVRFYPGRGDGWFGAGVCAFNPPTGGLQCDCNNSVALTIENAPALEDVHRTPFYVHDVTGDGLADFVVPTATSGILVYENTGAATFGYPQAIPTYAIPDWDPSTSQIQFADMAGAGIDDIVVITPSRVHYFNLFPGGRPGLLTRIDNGMGGVSALTYNTTAQLSIASTDNGSQWNSESPESLAVVTSLTTTNGLAGSAQAINATVVYAYSNPVYDTLQHQFRGFRSVQSTLIGDSAVPDQSTTTLYAIGDTPYSPFNGIDIPSQNVRNFPTAIVNEGVSVTHNEYRFEPVLTGLDGRNIYLAYVEQTDRWLWNSLFDNEVLQTVTDVDAPASSGTTTSQLRVPGNATQLRQTRVLGGLGNNELQSVDFGRVNTTPDVPIQNVTTWELVGPPGTWVWRPTAQRVQYTSGGEAPRAYSYVYDPAGNLTDTYGTLTGTLSLQRGHEDPTAAYAKDPPITASVDGNVHLLHRDIDPSGDGNVVHLNAPVNKCVGIQYDTAFQQYPVLVHVFAGTKVDGTGCGTTRLDTAENYDAGIGKITATVDPTGSTWTTTYDAFGRFASATSPDPTTPGVPTAVPSTTADYTIEPGRGVRIHSQVLIGTRLGFNGDHEVVTHGEYRQAWLYLDGLGRALATISQGDSTGSYVLGGVSAVSADGYTLRVYEPTPYPGDPSSYNALATPTGPFRRTTYDLVGRPLEQFALDGTPAQKITYEGLTRIAADAEDLNAAGAHYDTPTTFRFDGHGRLASVQEVLHFHLVARGQPTSETITTTRSYLATGELRSLQRTDGVSSNYVHTAIYDSLGRMVENDEPNSIAHSRLVLRGNNPNQGWRYAYDDGGSLVGTSDARGCGENLYYDTASRLISEDFSPCKTSQPIYSDPNPLTGEGTEAFFLYDTADVGDDWILPASGRLTAVWDRASHSRFHYDLRGRRVGVERQLGRPDASATGGLANRYTNHWFAATVSYDEASRPITQTTGGDVPELMDASGASAVTATYSPRGLLVGVGSGYGGLLSSATYAADGLILSIGYGDASNTTAAFSYDTLRRLRNKTLYQEVNFSRFREQFTLEDTTVSYDRMGNPTNIADNRRPTQWPAGAKPITMHGIAYDDLYRMQNVQYASGGDVYSPPSLGISNALPDGGPTTRMQFQSFAYDAQGNTVQTTDDANAFFDRSLGTVTNGGANGVGPDQLSGATNGTDFLSAHYDEGGELSDLVVQRTAGCSASSGACTHRFVYDWDEIGNMLRARRWDYVGAYSNSLPAYPQVPGSTPAVDIAMQDDALGKRVLKGVTAEGTTSYFAEVFPTLRVDQTSFNAEANDYEVDASTEQVYLGIGGVAVGRITYASGVAADSPAEQHVLLDIVDRLGSTSTVIDRASGDIVERTTYQPYGGADSDYRRAQWNVWERYRFTGKEADAEVGLTYFGARYYSSALGRWLSPDPLSVHGFAGDPNPYAYVGGAVLAATDPSGLCDQDPCPTNLGQSTTETGPATPPGGQGQSTGWVEGTVVGTVAGCGTGEVCASDAPSGVPFDLDPVGSNSPQAQEDNAAIAAALQNFGVNTAESLPQIAAGPIPLNSASVPLGATGLSDPLDSWRSIFAGSHAAIPTSQRGSYTYWGTTAVATVLGILVTHGLGEEAAAEELPYQLHHFASNKSATFTEAFEQIVARYGLDLDEPWNTELLQHLGRHPDEYHEFVLQGLRESDQAANGDLVRFFEEFETRVKSVVRENPGMLRKAWWE